MDPSPMKQLTNCPTHQPMDPLGIRPLFARRVGVAAADACVVSPRICDLVRPDEQLDPLGLAVLLTFGFPLGDRTVFRDVRRVGAGECVDLKSGISVGDCGRVNPSARLPDDDELLEIFLDGLQRSLGQSSPIVPLSGGRDSRLILLGMRALGVRPRRLLTCGGLGASEDAIVATRLARFFAEPIEGVATAAFSAQTELWRHRAQNFESLEHGWFVNLALRTRALGGPVTDGIGLGVLSTGSLMKPEAVALWRSRRLNELAGWTIEHAAGTGSEVMQSIARCDIPLASADEVRHAFVQSIEELDHLPNPLGAFSLFHWTRRGISASAFGLLDAYRTIAPLCDARLASALLAEDLDRARASDWRERLIRRLDDSGIPFSDDSSAIPASGGRSWISSKGARVTSAPTRAASAWAWKAFARGTTPRLRPLAEAVGELKRTRRTFGRSALGCLAALIASTHGGA